MIQTTKDAHANTQAILRVGMRIARDCSDASTDFANMQTYQQGTDALALAVLARATHYIPYCDEEQGGTHQCRVHTLIRDAVVAAAFTAIASATLTAWKLGVCIDAQPEHSPTTHAHEHNALLN